LIYALPFEWIAHCLPRHLLGIGYNGCTSGREYDVERLCSSFDSDFCGSSTCAPGEAYKPVGSADWAIQGFHECIVGCSCRFCADCDLGLYAITAVVAARRNAPGADGQRSA
jgi:hypothetical protein